MWQQQSPLLLLLWPISVLFGALSRARRGLYRWGLLPSYHPGVPVVVVGNISVGGSGKTPLVVWICERLSAQGYSPGIISRGYGGQSKQWPQVVTADSDAALVGDETVLLARRTGCPLVAAPDRVAAAMQLQQQFDVDCIISDDGMQHYRLQRDIEIAVIDGERRLGNGMLLPAGPLREAPRRLQEVDWVISNGKALAGEIPMSLVATEMVHLVTGERQSLSDWQGRQCHAVAGIGHPQRFFVMLQSLGLDPIPHPFPDHHPYTPKELAFADRLPIVMTEKDAVKCTPFANERIWYIPVTAQLPKVLDCELTQLIESLSG